MLAKVNLSIIWLSRINTQINYIDGQITISKSIINRYVSLDVVDFANSLDKCADLLSVNFVSRSSPPFYLKSEVAIEFVNEKENYAAWIRIACINVTNCVCLERTHLSVRGNSSVERSSMSAFWIPNYRKVWLKYVSSNWKQGKCISQKRKENWIVVIIKKEQTWRSESGLSTFWRASLKTFTWV